VLFLFVHHITNGITIMQLSPMEMEQMVRWLSWLPLCKLCLSNYSYDAVSFNLSLHIQSNEKSLQRWLDHELEVMVNVHEVRFEYEKQSQVYELNSIFGNSICFITYYCSFVLIILQSTGELHLQKSWWCWSK
jgi:hypothetical protein